MATRARDIRNRTILASETYLTARDAAAHLAVSETTLRKLAQEHRFHEFRLTPRTVRYRLAELEAYAEQSRRYRSEHVLNPSNAAPAKRAQSQEARRRALGMPPYGQRRSPQRVGPDRGGGERSMAAVVVWGAPSGTLASLPRIPDSACEGAEDAVRSVRRVARP